VRVRIAAAVLGCTLLGASGAAGQPAQLAGPAEVVIFVPNTLKSTDFIEPLVCALKRVLVAPVSTLKIGLPLSRDMLATATQYDVRKVAESFEQATAHKGGNSTFKYLLLPYDLKDRPYNYVFATSYGNRTTTSRLGIISTARLDVSDPTVEHHTGADLTALRVYKLMLKSIARLAGLASPDRCILAFPRSLPELDRKSAEFCADDHDALVGAAILKADESDTSDCIAISEYRNIGRFALGAN
jgi:predicted Zn-dependent protease